MIVLRGMRNKNLEKSMVCEGVGDMWIVIGESAGSTPTMGRSYLLVRDHLART